MTWASASDSKSLPVSSAKALPGMLSFGALSLGALGNSASGWEPERK